MFARQNNYSYPIDPDWTVEEINEVIGMFRVVEDAYEVGVNRQVVIDQYKKFKRVANSKAYEKRLGKQFEDVSGYSLYQVVQMARERSTGEIQVSQDGK